MYYDDHVTMGATYGPYTYVTGGTNQWTGTLQPPPVLLPVTATWTISCDLNGSGLGTVGTFIIPALN